MTSDAPPAAPPSPPPLAPSAISPALALRRRNNRRLFWCSTLLVGALAGWSTQGQLDVVSLAVGEVIPASHVKAIQHLEGGIVSAILVHEGERVSKGQALFQLDKIKATSDREELATRLTGLDIDLLRLTAEAEQTDSLVIPTALAEAAPNIAHAAQEAFQSHRDRLLHEVQTQEALIAQRSNDIAEINARLRNNEKTLAVLNDQVGISEKLMAQQLTSRMAHLDLVRQHQILKGQIENDRTTIPRIDAALREAHTRLATVRDNAREQARKDLIQTRQSRDELAQRLQKFQNAEERTVLRSPVDGLVKSIAIATEGGVIQPGQTVAEIVPVEDRLVIEARLPVQDIGYIHAGQAVRVSLASPDAGLFGHIEGSVETISPDATSTSEGRTFYRIRVSTISGHFAADGQIYNLYPGVQVQCAILTGTRTVFQYIFSPLLRSAGSTFQER